MQIKVTTKFYFLAKTKENHNTDGRVRLKRYLQILLGINVMCYSPFGK